MFKCEFRKLLNKKNNILLIIIPIMLYIILSLYKDLSIEKISSITYIYLMFVSIILLVISSNIYYNEISSGTIKILVKSNCRKSIIFNKLLIIFIMFITYFLLTLLSNILFIYVNNISVINIFAYIKNHFIYAIPCLFIILFSYYLSIIINNGLISVVCSTILFVINSLIFQKLMEYKLKIFSYTFLPYLDFYVIKNNAKELNNLYNIDLSIKKGIIIFIITLLFMHVLSNIIFKKKDIN